MRRRVIHACLPAIVVALLAAPTASAEVLSVDDDRNDCTAAGYTSVQDAIDAAAPGDTIAICPGDYVEGTGDANTNAITVNKSLTLKGAGADLVTIRPRLYDGSDGSIAEGDNDPSNDNDPNEPIPPQRIRHPRGNILTAVGSAAVPITVDVSGITFDGGGVAVKAGVVFIDAQGALRRSRVTNVVTSESPGAHDVYGGYRSYFLGYGVAQVTRATPATAGPGSRTLSIVNTRIDEYNRIGVLFHGGSDDEHNAGDTVTPSGLDLRGEIRSSQIVGRTLCFDANVHGECGGPNPPGNPDPKPIADGPLFGQDGVQIAAGARGTVTESMITQNLVQGTGAPVRGQPTNNANLRNGAGIRLVGADAANSLVTRTNIVDNAYGILNAGANPSSDAGTVLPAPANWWGLCSPVGNTRCDPSQPAPNQPPPNTGPDVSPTTNPPYPENPVNGTRTSPSSSSTVDFTDFRNGPQSDPNSGQYPVVPAPIPVSDEPPAVSVRPERAAYGRGETVTLIAEPVDGYFDDFGIRRVTFFDGAADAGFDESPPYTTAFTIPDNAECGSRRPVAATAEDSAGQTATGTSTVLVTCAGGGGGGGLQGPTVKLPDNLRTIRRTGANVLVRASSPQGIRSVDLFLGARRICTDTEAPYRCRIKPHSDEIGSQTVRAVATDGAGLTGQDTRQVTIPKFKPRGLMIEVTRKQLPGNRVQKTLTARVLPTKGVRKAAACRGGRVTAVVRRQLTTLRDVQVKLDSRCRARIMRFTTPHNESRRFLYKVIARFGGTEVMSPVRRNRRFS